MTLLLNHSSDVAAFRTNDHLETGPGARVCARTIASSTSSILHTNSEIWRLGTSLLTPDCSETSDLTTLHTY